MRMAATSARLAGSCGRMVPSLEGTMSWLAAAQDTASWRPGGRLSSVAVLGQIRPAGESQPQVLPGEAVEHHQKLLAGDALLRAEGALSGAGGDSLDIAPAHIGGVPAVRGHIPEAGLGAAQLLLRRARQAVQHRHQHGPVHRQVR